MDDLYTLNKDKKKYSNLKYNLNKIYNILSRTDVSSDLNSASSILLKNYTINNNSKYYKEINNIRDDIFSSKKEILNIINNIDYKINNINKSIRELE